MKKNPAIRLLNLIEELQIENRAYRAVLHELRQQLPPEGLLKRLVSAAQEEARGQVQPFFASLREHIQRSNDLERALQEIQLMVPAKKDVN